MKIKRLVAIARLCFSLAARQSLGGTMYQVVGLGILSGFDRSYGTGINATGQIVGYATAISSDDSSAFLYSGGVYGTDAGGVYSAFPCSGGVITGLGSLPGGMGVS